MKHKNRRVQIIMASLPAQPDNHIHSFSFSSSDMRYTTMLAQAAGG